MFYEGDTPRSDVFGTPRDDRFSTPRMMSSSSGDEGPGSDGSTPRSYSGGFGGRGIGINFVVSGGMYNSGSVSHGMGSDGDFGTPRSPREVYMGSSGGHTSGGVSADSQYYTNGGSSVPQRHTAQPYYEQPRPSEYNQFKQQYDYYEAAPAVPPHMATGRAPHHRPPPSSSAYHAGTGGRGAPSVAPERNEAYPVGPGEKPTHESVDASYGHPGHSGSTAAWVGYSEAKDARPQRSGHRNDFDHNYGSKGAGNHPSDGWTGDAKSSYYAPVAGGGGLGGYGTSSASPGLYGGAPMHSTPGLAAASPDAHLTMGLTSTLSESDVEDIFSFARHERCADIERLLDRGIPINVRDDYGNTLLTIACQNGSKRVAKIVLRRGADINSRNHKGNTPLHYCFQYGYGASLGEYLISKGADPNIRNNAGRTCYDVAP